jgi:hypothetical protein
MDSASAVLSEGLDLAEAKTLVALSKSGKIPYTTLWHRAHGRPSLQDKARGQQYLTPSEEEALVQYFINCRDMCNALTPAGYVYVYNMHQSRYT